MSEHTTEKHEVRLTQAMSDRPSRAPWLLIPVVLLLVLAVPVVWFVRSAAPPPGDAALKVTMPAGWAWIEVDGVRLGQAPGAVTVKPGAHQVRFTREGFQAQTRMINVEPGAEQVLDIALAP